MGYGSSIANKTAFKIKLKFLTNYKNSFAINTTFSKHAIASFSKNLPFLLIHKYTQISEKDTSRGIMESRL